MKLRFFVLGALLLFLFSSSLFAYSCLFSGSYFYPAENKAYCFENKVMKNCEYPYSYFWANCLWTCCDSLHKFETEFTDCSTYNDKSEANHEDLDPACANGKASCVAEGKCIQMSFNSYCYLEKKTATEDDIKYLENCTMECAAGYFMDVGRGANTGYAQKYEAIPPTLRECFCNAEKARYGSSFPTVCDKHNGVTVDPGTTTPPTTPPANGPCKDIHCNNRCEVIGGVATLKYDGTCREKGTSDYECVYAQTKECDWGCDDDTKVCVDVAPVQVTIQSPSDGAPIDTAKEGSGYINVTGFVSPSQGVESVLITVGMTYPQPATYEAATGKFHYDNLLIMQGRPVRITATAMKNFRYVRLGSESITVYPAPKALQTMVQCSGGKVTPFLKGVPVSCDELRKYDKAQDGEELQISGDGAVWIEYSDGTIIYLKSPARVRYWQKGIYVDYGGVEIEVSHDYEVLTRQGHYVAKGTHFFVNVPQEQTQPDTLTVMKGTVVAMVNNAEDHQIDVAAGKKITVLEGKILKNGDVTTAPASELVKFAGAVDDPFNAGVGTSASSSGTTDSTPNSSSGGCCPAAIIPAILLLFAALRRDN